MKVHEDLGSIVEDVWKIWKIIEAKFKGSKLDNIHEISIVEGKGRNEEKVSIGVKDLDSISTLIQTSHLIGGVANKKENHNLLREKI